MYRLEHQIRPFWCVVLVASATMRLGRSSVRRSGLRSGVGDRLPGVKQGLERLGEHSTLDTAVFTDEQLLEEPLIDLSPDVAGCLSVGGLAVGGGHECGIEGGFDVLVRGLGCGDGQVGFLELAGKPLHLRGEEILGDGAGIVGVQELLSFAFCLGPTLRGTLEIAPGVVLLARQFISDGL
ncbi:MAG TPA: hypothetical protein VHV74_04530, partial [Pseudonocardiaceae bacterium]|nr:hypothetical protein [Pseudonocardiaceae bacterium]